MSGHQIGIHHLWLSNLITEAKGHVHIVEIA